MAKWLEKVGPNSDIVISSRVRLARNIDKSQCFFKSMIEKEEEENLINDVYNSIINSKKIESSKFMLKKIKDLSEVDRAINVEKHLISTDLAKNTETGAMINNDEETIIVMLNEEDHIRIQCLLPGLQIVKALELANNIDDAIEENINYAFMEEFGYLTSCPTNVGTGLRASVMLHLPAISLTSHIKALIEFTNRIGLVIRGYYGEGSNNMGNIYQLSNQISLGVSEEDIVKKLRDVTIKIIEKEKSLRDEIMEKRAIQIENKVFRSLGILKNARIISSEEAMGLLSDIKLGVNLGLIDGIDNNSVTKLMTIIQPGFLQKKYEKEFSIDERDIKRALLIREKLK